MKLLNRIVAFLLLIVMIVGCFPIGTLAANEGSTDSGENPAKWSLDEWKRRETLGLEYDDIKHKFYFYNVDTAATASIRWRTIGYTITAETDNGMNPQENLSNAYVYIPRSLASKGIEVTKGASRCTQYVIDQDVLEEQIRPNEKDDAATRARKVNLSNQIQNNHLLVASMVGQTFLGSTVRKEYLPSEYKLRTAEAWDSGTEADFKEHFNKTLPWSSTTKTRILYATYSSLWNSELNDWRSKLSNIDTLADTVKIKECNGAVKLKDYAKKTIKVGGKTYKLSCIRYNYANEENTELKTIDGHHVMTLEPDDIKYWESDDSLVKVKHDNHSLFTTGRSGTDYTGESIKYSTFWDTVKDTKVGCGSAYNYIVFAYVPVKTEGFIDKVRYYYDGNKYYQIDHSDVTWKHPYVAEFKRKVGKKTISTGEEIDGPLYLNMGYGVYDEYDAEKYTTFKNIPNGSKGVDNYVSQPLYKGSVNKSASDSEVTWTHEFKKHSKETGLVAIGVYTKEKVTVTQEKPNVISYYYDGNKYTKIVGPTEVSIASDNSVTIKCNNSRNHTPDKDGDGKIFLDSVYGIYETYSSSTFDNISTLEDLNAEYFASLSGALAGSKNNPSGERNVKVDNVSSTGFTIARVFTDTTPPQLDIDDAEYTISASEDYVKWDIPDGSLDPEKENWDKGELSSSITVYNGTIQNDAYNSSKDSSAVEPGVGITSDRDADKLFDAVQGIPTNKYLYTWCKADRYATRGKVTKTTVVMSIPVLVQQTFNLTWVDIDEEGNQVPGSDTQTKQLPYTFYRTMTYYSFDKDKGDFIDVFTPRKSVFRNSDGRQKKSQENIDYCICSTYNKV
ncbi:MAG: DUF5704 domain-containing protein [Lachnospiraceae bacterium]